MPPPSQYSTHCSASVIKPYHLPALRNAEIDTNTTTNIYTNHTPGADAEYTSHFLHDLSRLQATSAPDYDTAKLAHVAALEDEKRRRNSGHDRTRLIAKATSRASSSLQRASLHSALLLRSLKR